MVNTLSLGQVKVGKIIGEIHATAGSIGSSELATDAVISAKIAAAAVLSTHYGTGSIDSSNIAASEIKTTNILDKNVTQAKIAADWSTLSNSTKSTTEVTVPAALGGYFLTEVGSSLGMVLVSAKLSDPAVGDHYKFCVGTTPSTIPIHIKSTSATFDGTNEYILLNAVGDSVWIEAATTDRWIIIGGNSYATAAST